MKVLLASLVFTLCTGVALGQDAPKAKRLALVIGNGAYKDVPLPNPLNDAEDMEKALKASGFTVIKRTNASLKEMHLALRGVRRLFRVARGQTAERRGDGLPSSLRIEVADQRDLQIAVRERGRKPRFELLQRSLLDLLARRIAEARIVGVDEARDLRLQHAAGRAGEIQVQRTEPLTKALERFWTVAWIGEVGGEHLQLEQQISRRGTPGECECVIVYA